jgi:aspartyl-tRNA(Asn)/glutamyl-tRNA(Gln) amidotransferase subunit B
MRTKEDAADYRYFPDPDLPPLMIGADWIERVKAELPELPAVMAARFEQADGLPAYDAQMMTASLPVARYYEAAKAAGAPAKLVANWVMGEISRRLNAEEKGIEAAPVSPTLLAALISNNAARQVFDQLWAPRAHEGFVGDSWEEVQQGFDVMAELRRIDELINEKGLKQMSDTGELERILDEVLAANAKSVEEFRAGKDKAFNALVGQAMKATKGKANPGLVNELLKKKLGA